MTKLTIKITKDVLRESMNCGVGKDKYYISKNCAVAVAIRDIFPTAEVRSYEVEFSDKKIKLPLAASAFIDIFDDSTPEERLLLPEFSFDIEIPDEVVDTISIDEIKRIVQGSKTLELV